MHNTRGLVASSATGAAGTSAVRGRLAEARSEFQTAATLTRNAGERAFLLARADACDSQQ